MKEFLNYTLIQLGDYTVKVSSLLKLIVFLIIIILLLKIIKQAMYRSKKIDIAKKYAIYNLIKYFILVFSFVIGFQILGFNLSVLIAGSAALLVGLGLGLQNLFSDFISGIILLVDSSVKVNDIIDVNGLVCKVQEINLRTTTVLTRDDKYIILPNSDLTRNQLINWTHSDINSRFEIKVGVDYTSDVKLVMSILQNVLISQKGIKDKPAPFVRFEDYAESSLEMSLFFWTEDVFRVENVKSEIRVRVFEQFRLHNVTIPFPQRVLHIKESDLKKKLKNNNMEDD
ncbi:MAG: mechanosensitive ion channel domain-containing protein [Ginsengibacter sp.]